MSNTPSTPSRPRRATSQAAASSTTENSKSARAAELANLPEVIEGTAVDLDPALASSGKIGSGPVGEVATIKNIKFAKFTYNGRPDIPAELAIMVNWERHGDAEERFPERYSYGSFGTFATNADGSRAMARPAKPGEKERKFAPQPYKFAAGNLLLESFIKAGVVTKDELNKGGLKVLIGKQVHVRRRKLPGMGDMAKPLPFPVFPEDTTSGGGSSTSGSAQGSTGSEVASSGAQASAGNETKAQAAVATTTGTVSVDITKLAEKALVDVLKANGNSIKRDLIPTTLIRLPEYDTKNQDRPAILKALRSGEIINDQNGVLWEVNGDTVTLL